MLWLLSPGTAAMRRAARRLSGRRARDQHGSRIGAGAHARAGLVRCGLEAASEPIEDEPAMVLHEDPLIPNYGKKGTGQEVAEGMVLAIEVMYSEGKEKVEVEPDGWTIRMRDGRISALSF